MLSVARAGVRADGAAPRLTGYASTFADPFDVGGPFGWTEVVAPGAFTRAIDESQDVRLLVNHEGLPLARTTSGTLTLTEDRTGLRVDATLDPADPDVQALLPKMRRGDLDQMSIAFVARGEKWSYGKADARDVRTITDVDLFDVSVVTYPANPNTSASVRSAIDAELDEVAGAYRIACRALRGADLTDDDRAALDRGIAFLRSFTAPAPALPDRDRLRRRLDLVARTH